MRRVKQGETSFYKSDELFVGGWEAGKTMGVVG